MSTTTDDALRESLLAAGRQPRLQTAPIDATVAPSLSSPGYNVANVSRAALSVQLGQAAPYRRTVLTIPTFDASSTYTLTVGTTTVTDATPADAETALASLAADLVTAAIPGYTIAVTATSLTVTGPATLVSWTATTGSPVLAMTTDYVTARARLYASRVAATFGSRITDADQLNTALGWAWLPGYDLTVGLDGWTQDAACVGAIDALRWWLTDLAGHAGDACTPGAITYTTPTALVLPCLLGAT